MRRERDGGRDSISRGGISDAMVVVASDKLKRKRTRMAQDRQEECTRPLQNEVV